MRAYRKCERKSLVHPHSVSGGQRFPLPRDFFLNANALTCVLINIWTYQLLSNGVAFMGRNIIDWVCVSKSNQKSIIEACFLFNHLQGCQVRAKRADFFINVYKTWIFKPSLIYIKPSYFYFHLKNFRGGTFSFRGGISPPETCLDKTLRSISLP